ncbi:error-prone DNA polymerase [Planctomycetota bacterium]|nr:error-prone DNA polymerase [Planctomycetota bacterium]
MPEIPSTKLVPHPAKAPGALAVPGGEACPGDAVDVADGTPYAELAVASNFSFLRGASHPEELVHTAAALGHRAAAIADRNSLAGIVRAHVAAEECGIGLAVGARLSFDLEEGGAPEVLAFPRDRAGYGRLSRLLTRGKRRAEKGSCHLELDDLLEHQEGLLAVVLPPELAVARPTWAQHERAVSRLRGALDPDRLFLGACALYGPDDRAERERTARLGARVDAPLVALNDVHYHERRRRALQDVLTAIRVGRPVDTVGADLFPNAERRLKTPAEMAALFRGHEDLTARAAELAQEAARFSLSELRYHYPSEVRTDGRTALETLVDETWRGAAERYPHGVPPETRARIEHEFQLIEELDYAPYFLTVHDIVRFARSREIMCQGRGAAANSAVCYCLGVTAVDPDRIDLLFERFLSKERGEPPDIDIDFEHERREEVLQYVYRRYGRDRAALTAEVISYRGRSAVRDVGKALGFSPELVDALAKDIDWWTDGVGAAAEENGSVGLAAHGLDPQAPATRRFVALTKEILGFPRHLSQHVGGFVITEDLLTEMVPIENASMADRTVIEWDKDDIDALGILKVDLLGLGMLTAIRKTFELVDESGAERGFEVPEAGGFTMHTIPPEDPAVYEMMCRADTMGVFQIESRAQMSMLPRLKPVEFYDLVVEVAIVRPGPIQGDMVHPYLRRRDGTEAVTYPSPEVRRVLEKTLGVPLFQEQAMALAVVAAGFTPGEADKLRRAMAAWKRKSDLMQRYGEQLVEGMLDNGYDEAFAQRIFRQLEGFSEYGFPESHAASFALLVYVSSWLKLYHPGAFCGALINSQPMGFYAPAQLVQDAERHGVEVRPVDVNHSRWDCSMEGPALRLGMCLVKGLRQPTADAISAARARLNRPFRSVDELQRQSGLRASRLRPLASADAFGSLELDRKAALWAVRALRDEDLSEPGLFAHVDTDGGAGAEALPPIAPLTEVVRDYATQGLSLKAHPVSFLRPALDRRRALTAAALLDETRCPQDARVAVAGMVLVRQRPATAQGIIFITLEDETGTSNLVVHPRTYERHRAIARHGVLLLVEGRIDRSGEVVHLIADRFEGLDDLAAGMRGGSRDFH